MHIDTSINLKKSNKRSSDHYDNDKIQWCLITFFRCNTEVLRVLTSLIKGSNLLTRWPQMAKICSVFMCLHIHFSLPVFIWRIQWFPESKCPQTRHDLFFVSAVYVVKILLKLWNQAHNDYIKSYILDNYLHERERARERERETYFSTKTSTYFKH